MAINEISPELPITGERPWGGKLNAAINQVTQEVNDLVDVVENTVVGGQIVGTTLSLNTQNGGIIEVGQIATSNFLTLTQTEYNAIPAKDPNTFYIIVA